MQPEQNPFAAPQVTGAMDFATIPAVEGDLAQAESMRRMYLKHEASVKSIGWLYYLGSLGNLGIAAVLVIGLSAGRFDLGGTSGTINIGLALLILAIGVLAFLTAGWLRKLDSRARMGVGIVSGFALLSSFTSGSFWPAVISIYILWLVFSEKGKVVFSDRYRDVMRLTPHIKYRSPVWLMILAAVLVALMIVAII